MRSIQHNNEEQIKLIFSQNLKFLRLSKPNLSQQAIADIIGISQRSISNYENGKILPPVYIMERFSHFFKVPLEDLMQNNLNTQKGGNK